MWEWYNPNPKGKQVDDCVIRAISAVTGSSWEQIFIDLSMQGLLMADMPSSNIVWSLYLKRIGFKRKTIEDCPMCYTVKDFCCEHPVGTFVVGTGTHAVAVIDGKYLDAWDSGEEQPTYYFVKQLDTKQ